MTLEQARQVVQRHSGSYSEWAHACAIVYENHMRERHPDTKLTSDQQPPGMGSNPESPTGAQLVMLLPGPASAYFIANVGADSTGLFRSSDVDGVLDPGTGGGLTGDTLQKLRTADAVRSKKTLSGINAANRKYWEQNSA